MWRMCSANPRRRTVALTAAVLLVLAQAYFGTGWSFIGTASADTSTTTVVAPPCPCINGCFNAMCWKTAPDSSPTVCKAAVDPATNMIVPYGIKGWSPDAVPYNGKVQTPLLVVWTNYQSCTGICTGQGCVIGTDTEDASQSCGEPVYQGDPLNQRLCVPPGGD